MNAPSARLYLSLPLLICLLLLPPPAFAEEENSSPEIKSATTIPAFDVLTLKRPGLIFMAASGDLDGDGELDLLLFHRPSKEAYEKHCSVYFRSDGIFPTTPPLQVQLGDTTGAIDITDIDSDGADELCGFDGEGMTVFEMNDGAPAAPARTLRRGNLLPRRSRRMIAVDWTADLDSDGRTDVALPTADGLVLLLQREGGDFVEAKTFELPMRASVRGESGQTYISYRLPTIGLADYDGDGYTDVGAFDFEQMNFLLTDGSPMPTRSVASPLVRKFEKDFIGGSGFSDLNGDGAPDAVLVLMSQKKNLQSETRIYFGGEDLSYPDEPTHTFSGESNLILPMFLDATGDGKMEMLLQNINVGFGFFLNYFLRNRIRVDTELRRLGPDGRYDDEPAVRRAIYVRASETGAEPARGIGDFNGDGLDDLAVGTSEERLSFYLSNEDVIMPARPSLQLDVPAYGSMTLMDLNNDGREDMIILYSQDDKLDTATLLLSK